MADSDSDSSSGWDASTISSVTALIIAVIAMIIALAQAVQQYFITGQLIRICDSVVFGPMPGRGRRVWQPSQFRFRVLYSVPQISLVADLWPSNMKSYAIGQHPLPPLAMRSALPDDDMDEMAVELLLYHSPLSTSPSSKKWRRILDSFPRINNPFRRDRLAATRNEYEEDGSMSNDVRIDIRVPGPPAAPSSRHMDSRRFLSSRWWWSVFFRRRIMSPMWWRSLFTRKLLRSSSRSDVIIYSEDAAARRRRATRTSSRSSSATDVKQHDHVGEASWVSFCRAIEMSCGESVRLDHVNYDADRCPSDLVAAPMQVSMRDTIIMGLMAGMEITSASFANGSISMQGAVGTITSSKHAVLGPILHFTPRNDNHVGPAIVFSYPLRMERGFIDTSWLARTWDVCCVARSYLNSTTRRTTRRLDDRWIRDQDDLRWDFGDDSSDSSDGRRARRNQRYKRKGGGWTRDVAPVHPDSKRQRHGKSPERKGNDDNGRDARDKRMVKVGREVPEPLPQDGCWQISRPVNPKGGSKMPETRVAQGQIPMRQKRNGPAKSGVEVAEPDAPTIPPVPTRRVTVEDAEDEGEKPQTPPIMGGMRPEQQFSESENTRTSSEAGPSTARQQARDDMDQADVQNLEQRRGSIDIAEEDEEDEEKRGWERRVKTAKELQAARTEKLNKIRRDKELVEDWAKRGEEKRAQEALPPPPPPPEPEDGQRPQLLLTNFAHNQEPEDDATKEEREAREREERRAEERAQRELERDERNRARNRAVGLTHVDLYWMSQIDIVRGAWATPWQERTPIYSALTGCVTVVLEALLGFLGSQYIVYRKERFLSNHEFLPTARWMCEPFSLRIRGGKASYNHTYPAYAHNARGGVIAEGEYIGCRISAFPARVIPVLELAYSYDWQVDDQPRDQLGVEEQNVELMRIDSWLSYVGRLDEISDGPHRLLRQTPALVDLIMQDFEHDFQNVDLSAKEGGLQDIQGLAANLMDFLTDEELTDAEQLYVLVALLRSVKVAQSVRAGSDTAVIREILWKDIQAHLV